MGFCVEFTARAELDLREIHAFIEQHGPSNAKKWRLGLLKKLSDLERYPNSFQLAPEDEHSDRTTPIRQHLYYPFRILYSVIDDTVYILTIRHGSRRLAPPEDLR
jgi:plasmid stabilization system protein ParE